MIYLFLLYWLFGIAKPLTAETVSAIQSTFKIVYSVRIYQRVGPSHEQWREMTPPDLQSTTSLEAKARCTDGAVTPSPENKTRAEQCRRPRKAFDMVRRRNNVRLCGSQPIPAGSNTLSVGMS